jgi:dolichol-phosphate mannosyltransferase
LEKTRNCIIIIPAYNEEGTIKKVVTGAQKYGDVCVVDDCSEDFTPEILKNIKGIHVVFHQKNTHIPGCLLDGMRYAVEKNYRYAVSMDAGLSHNPDEIPLFLKHPEADLVIGCRKEKISTPLFRRALSRAGNFVYNLCIEFPKSMAGGYCTDLPSGFRRYSYKAMKLLLARSMKSRSFDFMVESARYISAQKLTISEVPITYRYSNSSLNVKVLKDCITMCLKILLTPP